MSTRSPDTVLFGKTQRSLLAIFFTRPEQAYYLRQVIRMANGGQGGIQREIKRWVQAGLLKQTRQGNQVHYQVNQDLAIYPELKGIALKTCGIAGVLRDALDNLSDRITLAFIHGSIAAGTEAAASDIDVMIVGDVTFGEVVAALQTAQERLGREVNPTVYSDREFQEKRRVGHHFLTMVLNGEKIFLIGNEHESV